MGYKYIFGPVMSSRLGRSLGLDLLGGRICTMDCVYCEVGATRDLTLTRKPYVPAADILAELSAWKDEGLPAPDMVTLGGLGEPCLNSEMADVITGARALFPGTDIAVLTNASLMTDTQVRKELAMADVVLPSLDSLVDDEFTQVNRPCEGFSPEAVAEGLLEFKKDFKGKIFLEILLAKGINETDENLGRLKDFCRQLSPDRVDVVTLTRPGTVKSIAPVDGETLERWRMMLGGDGPAEERDRTSGTELSMERITAFIEASLARRPQTVQQLADALGGDPETVRQAVEALEKSGDVISREDRGEIFYHGTGHVIQD